MATSIIKSPTSRPSSLAASLLAAAFLIGCQQRKLGNGDQSKAPPAAAATAPTAPAAPDVDLDSKDLLARTETSPSVDVKHVLIGWKDLAAAYHGHIDPRAASRSNADAAKIASDVFAQLKAKPDAIDALVKQYSEDPGSLRGTPYTVTSDSPMVPEFKKLALRLKVGEVGVVKTQFGYHVMERVAPPPPDSLESADILARAPTTQKAKVKHILLGWTDVHTTDPRGEKRTRAELETLVKKTVEDLKKGAKIEPLMKQLSEDPGSAESGESYDATPDAGLVEPFKNLSLRLNVGEVGVVKTDFGIHIIQRVE